MAHISLPDYGAGINPTNKTRNIREIMVRPCCVTLGKTPNLSELRLLPWKMEKCF